MLASIRSVVPISYDNHSLESVEGHLHLEFAVLIGFTGDQKGKFIFKGEPQVFSAIGESMFGMPLEGEMLISFAGELGNMISGGLCTNVSQNGIIIDITSPTIMEGSSKVSGFKKGMEMKISFHEKGELSLFLLLD
ncbi:chemotaxis protein CheX [Peribacillus saganii]|uniref:Chemotaxis protein CheX n=2 Tax=Peribacillus saganii TaxID=2303992 RepID=A0A372LTH4_9BACI|nr:chemotaxis protein CheX [Peribacillus saganii]